MVYIVVHNFAHRVDPVTRQVESCEVIDGVPTHKWRMIDGKEMQIDGSMKHELFITINRLKREFPEGYELPRAHSMREL